jgi:TolB-like protein/class 3 adenylate cyclase/tetratricopeptide (TPR) repeat protein
MLLYAGNRGGVLTSARVERRLAAVLAADVAGYSRLMGRDEEGTLANLKSLRKTLVDPTIAAHRGRIVKTTGDGVLVEFASAVDATRCAIEIQRGMAAQNAEVPQERKIEFRIGIHVGDIIIDDNDIFGDGVNIAARLEGIAEPGGVCMSDDAQRQVRGKVAVTFDDMGPQNLKNITEPMRVWRLRLDGGAASPAPAPSAGSAPPLALPEKPSIAVLPFQNMSGDPEQEHFADGMVEDIITGLSRSKALLVIARNSSFTYKGKAVDIKQVGRELGVRYVLEGSVRKSGNRARITGQLIDAATGAHLWAERFDGLLEDIFDLQDRVTSSVIGAILPHLERAEIERAQRKPTESLRAYDYYLRALAASYRFTREANLEMIELTQAASAIDPQFALPHALAIFSFTQRKAFGWSTNIVDEISETRRLAARAIELDRGDARVLAMAGFGLCYVAGEVEEGAVLLARAIQLDPNLVLARTWMGWTKVYQGDMDGAIEQLEIALRVNPLDPLRHTISTAMAYAHFFAGRNDEASALATGVVRQQPNFVPGQRIMMACHAVAGRLDEARQACAAALRIDPTQRISVSKARAPFRRPQDIEKLEQAFRIAGMPE